MKAGGQEVLEALSDQYDLPSSGSYGELLDSWILQTVCD